MPLPATNGEKVPPVMPCPAYIPPLGNPPASVKGAVVKHTGEKSFIVTVGGGKTVTDVWVNEPQPPFENV